MDYHNLLLKRLKENNLPYHKDVAYLIIGTIGEMKVDIRKGDIPIALNKSKL